MPDSWTTSILQYESVLRLVCFAGVFVTMALVELFFPRRVRTRRRAQRWPGNLTLVILDSLVGRVVAPAGAVGFALFAEARGWGVFSVWQGQYVLKILLAVLILDLAIYLQHRLFHALPILWRVHRLHHTDVDLDVTSGTRFHPLEIAVSLGIKFVVIVGLGAPSISVLVFEVLLNGTSTFNHSNVRIPLALDRLLRCIVVTPDMHRIHHSALGWETDSNFGFNLPWWDKLFRTYREQPEAGHDKMVIGLNQFRAPGESRLVKLLLQPFRQAEAGEDKGGA